MGTLFRIQILILVLGLATACGVNNDPAALGDGGGGDDGQSELSFIYTGETDITSANQASFEVKGNCSAEAQAVQLRGSILLNASCSDGNWSETIDLSYLPNGRFEVSITDGVLSGDLIFEKDTLKNDAVAVYEFEDSADLGKDTRAAHNAQSATNVSAVVDLERDNVVQFNGTDSSMQLSDGSFMNKSFSKRTISLWFNGADLSTRQMLYEEGGSGNGLAIRIENDELVVATRAGGDATQENLSVSLSGRASVWNHVAVVFDEGQLQVYLNGDVTEKTVAYTSVPSHGNDGGIGASYDRSNAFGTSDAEVFNGRLDDVMVFEAALGEAAVNMLAEKEIESEELDPLGLGLAAQYDFADSGDMGADSRNTHDATSVAGVTQENDAELGDVARFDGTTSSMQMNDGTYLNAAFTEKTVAMWVKPDDVFADAVIYDEGGSTNGMTIWFEDAFLFAAVRSGGSSSQTTVVLDIAELDGEWMHVAAVFDDGKLQLYVDGANEVERTASFTEVATHSDSGGLGRRYGSDSSGLSGSAIFAGLIDEFRIYDRAMTSTELEFLAD